LYSIPIIPDTFPHILFLHHFINTILLLSPFHIFKLVSIYNLLFFLYYHTQHLNTQFMYLQTVHSLTSTLFLSILPCFITFSQHPCYNLNLLNPSSDNLFV
jgi:hypothetical protein